MKARVLFHSLQFEQHEIVHDEVGIECLTKLDAIPHQLNWSLAVDLKTTLLEFVFQDSLLGRF